MLNDLLINSLDIFNIIYLWAVVSKKNSNLYKLLFSTIISIISITSINYFELNFIFLYISIIIIIKTVYRTKLKNMISEFFFILFIEMSFQAIINAITNKLILNENIEIITVELITLVTITIYSKLNFNKKINFDKISDHASMYIISTFGIEVIIFKIILIYNDTIIQNNLLITSVIIIVFSLFQIITYINIAKDIKEHEKLKIANEYNEVINEVVQEIKQRQHDFVNYKNTIRGIVEVVDKDKIGDAIRNYMNDEDIYHNKINELIYIENVVIKSIIYRSICKARKYNINFQYTIENNILDNILSYNEISNLLNNLLNNAFEEVIKECCTKKNIEIKILAENEAPHLIIKNQIADSNNININKMLTRGYSTKNSDTRGYGLYNVEQIISEHKGYMEIKVECQEIIFNIYFNKSSG
jgi:Signal transduction histidine kinase regulating citrate/malate metabolism